MAHLSRLGKTQPSGSNFPSAQWVQFCTVMFKSVACFICYVFPDAMCNTVTVSESDGKCNGIGADNDCEDDEIDA